MFNFFFSNNDDDLKDTLFSDFSCSAPLDNYHLFLKACSAKTWLGRSVYFLSSITNSLTYLLPLINLAQQFFQC